VVILGGLVFATSMTLFIVPVLYNLLARFASSANAVEKKLKALSEQPNMPADAATVTGADQRL